VRNAADVEQYRIFYHFHIVAGTINSGLSYLPALEALAGGDVAVIVHQANCVGQGIIFGWLEDA
jgi:hypothetical protein